MADKPLDERSVQAMLQKLKAYTTYKAQQLQTAGGGGSTIENDLLTIETWANDVADDGKAWGQQKQAESDAKLRDAEMWRSRVQADKAQAAKDAELRNALDMNKLKADAKKQLLDHQEAIKQLAEAGQPGFKGKLVEVKAEVAAAQEFLDKDFEKALDVVAQKQAAQRKKNELISKKMDERAADAKKWKQEYGAEPGKFPDGQRADVQAAVGRIEQWAAGKISELEPYAAKAANVIESLKQDQSWAATLKSQTAQGGPAAKGAKASAKAGVQHVRLSVSQAESFQAGLEGEANENMALYQQWTDRNNKTAQKWAASNSPKHREWAQAWQKTQE